MTRSTNWALALALAALLLGAQALTNLPDDFGNLVEVPK